MKQIMKISRHESRIQKETESLMKNQTEIKAKIKI